MDLHPEKLAVVFHELTDRPVEECARFISEIPPEELESIMAEAKAIVIAHMEAAERGAFFQMGLPTDRGSDQRRHPK